MRISKQLQSGEKFNRLTIVKLDHIKISKDNLKKEYYLCKCDCGNEKIVRKDNLIGNKIKSCGCLKKEIDKTSVFKHGLTKTRIFKIIKQVLCGVHQRSF